MNHLVSYSDTTHPYYFLTRFVEGLRSNIRAVVMVQRPMDLDTACSLALLQEEVTEGECISTPRQAEHRYIKIPVRHVQTQFQSVPVTPSSRATDSRGMDSARNSGNKKIQALRDYGRAKGLCYKCGERCGKEHSCPATVQMHVVEELLAMFTSEEITGSEPASPDSSEHETVCSLSIHAMNGTTAEASGVIQLHALLNDHEILILVDSGSSTSFINKQLAGSLSGAQHLSKACRVQVADGASH